MQIESLGSPFLPRFRLLSEDDDVFQIHHPITTFPSRPYSGDRGVKRSRLANDDDIFFRPRARLTSDSSPQFPRGRLPSDSSSLYYHRRFPAKENRPEFQPSRASSSSQYTADDTPDPAFKTPYSRPLRCRSSEMSSPQPNSTREDCHQLLKDPPRVTRTPFAWISPNVSDVSNAVPMSESINDVHLRLFHQKSFRLSVSDNSFSPLDYTHGTSRKESDCPQNLAHSILAEEMRSDSGISILPSFDGQVGFNQYQQDFGDRLVDVMVKILNKVKPSISPVSDHMFCCPVTEQMPDPHQPSSCLLSIPDLPHISTLSSPDNYASSDSSQASCFDSPGEVFPYPVLAPDQSQLDISAPVDFLSTIPSFISPSVIPSVIPSAPAPSPTDVSVPTHSLSSLYSQTLTSISEASPVPVSLPQKKKSSTKKSSQCKVCHKMLANSSNLKVHMRIHTGERPFVCPNCFKDFSDRTTFRRHKRLHTRNKFVCEHCSRSFLTRSKLYIHEQKCY